MTKENELHLRETLLNMKKGTLSLEEYIRKFKAMCDKLAAMKKQLDDFTKVLQRFQNCHAIKTSISLLQPIFIGP